MIKLFGFGKGGTSSHAGEFVREMMSNWAGDAIRERVTAVSELSGARTRLAADPDQQRLNGALNAAILGLDPVHRNKLLHRKRMAALRRIPEAHGIVYRITEDEWVAALTCMPGEFDGTTIELRDSWKPGLVILAELDENDFWTAVDGMWNYKSLAQIKDRLLKAGQTVVEVGEWLAATGLAETVNAADAILAGANVRVNELTAYMYRARMEHERSLLDSRLRRVLRFVRGW